MATCSLCCDESRAWAVGPCDHATCLMCSVRLRVLCEQRDCPVCREKQNKVLVTDLVNKSFSLPPHGSKVDRKYGFLFENPQLYDKYKSLQLYRCTKCREKPVFGNFSLLREHSRKTHGLYYCNICSENLKLFPFELRLYTRQELTTHRRDGDPDDKSYKGHPLCQFCDERFFDNDTLHAHLRKVHFWCHICESDGKQDYYCSYPLLRDHFRLEHYLCEEGACQQEKYTSVFRSKLDLQVHRATAHTKGVTKAEAKQMRQLDVGFTYGRGDEPNGGGVANDVTSGRGQWQHVQQRGKTSKNRNYKENEQVTVVKTMPSAPQRNTNPPLISREGDTSTTISAGAPQYVYARPPRFKHRQSQDQRKIDAPQHADQRPEVDHNKADSLSNTMSNSVAATTAAATEVKKPPGFEKSQPKATVNSDISGEWPDLLALSIAPNKGSKVVSSSTRRLPHPVKPVKPVKPPAVSSYNPLEPAHFPPLSNTAEPPYNTNSSLVGEPAPDYSTSRNASSNIPPGFVTPQWQLIQQDSVYNRSSNPTSASVAADTALSAKSKEECVINLVRQALDHDREKFNHFRNLSGWYRNSEITVQEYVLRCRQLFGDSDWRVVGPQLAQVMPIEGKRNELLLNVLPDSALSDYFPSSGFPQLSSANNTPAASLHMSHSEPSLLPNRQAKWREGKTMVPNWQSECEYPTLHSRPGGASMTRQLQSPGLPAHSWKTRVRV